MSFRRSFPLFARSRPALLDSPHMYTSWEKEKSFYPKPMGYMNLLETKYGDRTTWPTLPTEQQLRLHDDLCRHIDNLVFHRNVQRMRLMNVKGTMKRCYRSFHHMKNNLRTYGSGQFDRWAIQHLLGVSAGSSDQLPDEKPSLSSSSSSYPPLKHVIVDTAGHKVPPEVAELAGRYFPTWNEEGVYYPRAPLWQEVGPLLPGSSPRYGIVLVPWELHMRWLEGCQLAKLEIQRMTL
eukprot:PhF_6_TR37770/c0_g1_i2/m.56234